MGRETISVLLVGAGGTGSVMLTHLCRIAGAIHRLGGAPMSITVMDDDTVSDANLCRQVFAPCDLGSHKAAVLAQRARAFFGVQCEARIEKLAGQHITADIIIGCVDNMKARHHMAAASAPSRVPVRGMLPKCDRYWLDLGNTNNAGQIVLGGCGLPNVFDVLPQMKELPAKAKDDTPSCSLAEALSKQDLFINSTLGSLGAQLIWHLLRHGGLNHHGFFVNLHAGVVRPIICTPSSP